MKMLALVDEQNRIYQLKEHSNCFAPALQDKLIEVEVLPASEGLELWGVWNTIHDNWALLPCFETKESAIRYSPGIPELLGVGYEPRRARVYVVPEEEGK